MSQPHLGLNLRSQLAFYGAYHANPYNQLIHFFFVPVILFSVAVWLSYTPPVLGLDASMNGTFFLIFLPFSLFYALLDPVAGVTWSCCIGLPVWLGAEALRQTYPDDAWRWAIYAHVTGWFMQIVPGHGIFERRKPALLDSLFQSLILAPLFVWYAICRARDGTSRLTTHSHHTRRIGLFQVRATVDMRLCEGSTGGCTSRCAERNREGGTITP